MMALKLFLKRKMSRTARFEADLLELLRELAKDGDN
jgi:hypothetical protein